jgi:SAM-dependent methyltransferase
MGEWYEDDSFWADFGPVMFHADRLEQARAEVDALIKLMDLQPGARILDLPCGVGRHSIGFARRGFHVTAVDRTTSYLDRARHQAAKESLSIEFVQSDMRVFERADSFDGAINLFTSLGYFEDESDDLMVAHNFATSLKPGARLVVDVKGKEALARTFKERNWYQQPDGALFLEEGKIIGAWDRVESHWIRIHGADRKEGTLSVRLYSATELATLLKRAGFSAVSIYGSLEGAPYDQNAQRLIAVAQK